MKRTAVLCMLALSISVSSWVVPADAYERGRPWLSDQPWEKFSLTFGYFLTNFTSDVTVSSSGGGAVVNLEDLLGLDATTSQFRVDARYRAWRRHHFHFSFYDLSRDARAIVTGEIPREEPEDDILAGALVDSNLHIKMYKVGYTFSFWNDDRVDLGAGLGFHVMELGAGLTVLAGIKGGEDIVNERLLSEATTLPLPVLNLRANVAITKRVFFKQSFEVFYISLSGFEGLLLDTNLMLEGHITRFFGMGMGLNLLRIEIEGDGGDDFLGGGWDGTLDFDYLGVFVYGKFFF